MDSSQEIAASVYDLLAMTDGLQLVGICGCAASDFLLGAERRICSAFQKEIATTANAVSQ